MYNGEKLIDRPLRWGMVGGGRTGQVGYKHRTGALRDNTAYRLVCGAFDIDAERGRDFGRNLGVAEERLYPDYKTLIAEEAKRDDGVEVVTVATPNFSHYEITKALLEAGIHVICEKPLFFTVAECEEIAALAEAKGLIVGVTYGFTGHPLVHQMAAMVKKGMLGDIRMVDLQYTHGFNAGDDEGAPDAVKWRTNPKTSGPTFVLGDIGTHIYYLSEIVLPHMRIERLLCDRQSFIKSRAPLEDNAYVLSHYDNGAVGRLWVLLGQRRQHGQPALPLRRLQGLGRMDRLASRPADLRGPGRARPGHAPRHALPRGGEPRRRPHGRAAHRGPRRQLGQHLPLDRPGDRREDAAATRRSSKTHHYPGIEAGTEGVRWLENCVRSADAGSVWVDFK